MSILKGLQFIFSTSRGAGKIFSRMSTVSKRFDFTPQRQLEYLSQYVSLLSKHGVSATFFIPAKILERYITDLRQIGAGHVEWGIHGYIHTDLSRMNLKEQKEQINKAIEVFDKYDIEFKGFRAPYLKENLDTMQAIRDSNRFTYNSTVSILYDEVYGRHSKYFRWVNNFYRPVIHSALTAGLAVEEPVGIPVSLPDDDILVDREGLSQGAVFSAWREILGFCHARNEAFVLQLHPERIVLLHDALDRLIQEAKEMSPPVWITTMSELAGWKKAGEISRKKFPNPFKGAFCITGDIDALTIKDFFLRLKEW